MGRIFAGPSSSALPARVVSATQMVIYVLKGHDFSRAANVVDWSGL